LLTRHGATGAIRGDKRLSAAAKRHLIGIIAELEGLSTPILPKYPNPGSHVRSTSRELQSLKSILGRECLGTYTDVTLTRVGNVAAAFWDKMLGIAKIGRGNVWGPIFWRAPCRLDRRGPGRAGAWHPQVGGRAEELGLDILFLGDHLLAEARSKEGMAGCDAAMLDPFVMLMAVGARTTRLRPARVFPGAYEDAGAAYLIGSPDEVAERSWTQTEGLDRIDGYLVTPINDEAQLAIIARELRPKLAQSRRSTNKQRSAHVH
jgi:hypothetical protein